MKQVDHLGNILTEKGAMDQDATVKRAKFIQSSVEIRELFKFAAPEEILKSLKIYSNSFLLLWFKSLGPGWGQSQPGVQCLEHISEAGLGLPTANQDLFCTTVALLWINLCKDRYSL